MTNPLGNSMSALRWLYTVAAGFAVIRGVQTLAVNANGEVDIPWNGNLLVFVVFMSVLIRFSHGAIRHFYSSYEERNEGETWLWHEPLVDFFGLFAEACLFLLMAFSLRNHQQFTVFYFWLLAFDTLWLCLLPVKTDPPYRNWLVANTFLFAVTVPFFVCRGSLDKVLLPDLLGATAIHHILDYVSPGNWSYYFPGVARPGLVVWVEQRLGSTFLSFGNLLWAVIALCIGGITLKPLRARFMTKEEI